MIGPHPRSPPPSYRRNHHEGIHRRPCRRRHRRHRRWRRPHRRRRLTRDRACRAPRRVGLRPRRRFAGRRIAAVYYRARDDGRIDDAEARAIADAAGKPFADLEEAGAELLAEEPSPAS
ncbi:MAG: hypothetical protein ABFC89_10150 [Methanospirillum sp.]